MSRNYYSEINLHIVWHTKNSSPLLTPTMESLAHHCLKQRIIETPGAFIYQIGGTETHVHVAVTVPPTLTPSEWIGQLKGGSSHHVNQQAAKRQKVLQWQAGYGIVSFGTKDLSWVVQYVAGQREHHLQGKMHDRLERLTHEEP